MLIPLLLSLAVTPSCRAPQQKELPSAVIERAITALGIRGLTDHLRIAQGTATILENGQSDRPASPYYITTRPFSGPILDRAMDPWSVLREWRGDSTVRLSGECVYRDYWRTVLSRKREKLFIDSRTAFPVKLDRAEEHSVLGDVVTSYMWSLWTPLEGSYFPAAVFRMVNGETVETRMIDRAMLAPVDSPATVPPRAAAYPASQVPDTIRLSANTFALFTPAYTNVVSLQRDTVFILDAQMGEGRARSDSAWIAKLFGKHPVVLVVTDLAWPHIAGVRFWAAHGATIVTHRASVAFLRQVVDRRWTIEPDERSRSLGPVKITAVDRASTRAGGKVAIREIGGINSETALMVYLPSEHTLYAGDFVQNSSSLSFSATYAREIAAAVSREQFDPLRFVSMHVRPRPWSDISLFTKQK